MRIFSKTTRQIVQSQPREAGTEATEQGKGPQKNFFSLPNIAAGTAVLLLALILLLMPKPKAETTKLAGIPDGMQLLSVPVSDALTDQAIPGDLVQIYNNKGGQIPQLLALEVYSCGEDSLLLLGEPAQAAALAKQETVQVALTAKAGTEAAKQQLSRQAAVLHPQIVLKLPETLELQPDDDLDMELEIHVDPEDGIMPEVLWSSSDDQVCIVDDGYLYAASEGQCTITVRCGEAEAVCRVSVRIPLEDISLDQGDISLTIGSSTTIKAVPEPEDASGFAVQWTSSDPAVATVDGSGTVRAVASGTATITAVCGEKQAVCKVTVGSKIQLVQLDHHTLELAPGQTQQLKATLYPADTVEPVQYSSSGEHIVQVEDDGTVVAVAPGSAVVTVTCGEKTDTCTVTVSSSE